MAGRHFAIAGICLVFITHYVYTASVVTTTSAANHHTTTRRHHHGGHHVTHSTEKIENDHLYFHYDSYAIEKLLVAKQHAICYAYPLSKTEVQNIHKPATILGLEKEEFNKAEQVISNLQTLSLNAEDVIQSNNVEKSSIEYEKLSGAINLAETGFDTIPFLPTEISPYIVGSLQVVPNAVHIRYLKKFKTDISSVFNLSTSPDYSLYISDNNVLQRVKPEEHKLTVVSKYDIEVWGMAVHPLFYSTVHSTKDGIVTVGAYSGKPWPENGRRVIIVMKQNGEHQTIYEYDKHSIPIFTRPKSITSRDNGNICVVDEFGEDGRVVVLSQHGDILQIYRGHPDIDDIPFKPMRVEHTPSDNLIVTVFNSSTLHILYRYGQLITHYNLRDIGILCSFSLSFTKTGQLYVGCTGGAVGSSKKGKAHILHQIQVNAYYNWTHDDISVRSSYYTNFCPHTGHVYRVHRL
ncbi:unnamed protein product [Mytilus coruscus]|uniref:Uncharacterized protein n=1 Tax=Mytilus coruscus TaxID=42192 RepID=A0A6J8AZI4_MYTCO|nr:unnamed protein product [Mytilus coruscus]